METTLSDEKLFEIISYLIKKLSSLNNLWAFTGSVGQHVQGMDLYPHDVDIQTTKEGAYAIGEVLKEYCIEKVHLKESMFITSHFGIFNYNSCKIEVMGDLKKLVNNEWVKTPDLRIIIRKVTWKSLIVPVLDLQYEMQAYNILGRKERAEEIRTFLER